MASKFTASQLRGMKAEKEKEFYNQCINCITTLISSQILKLAEKGETKLVMYIQDSNGMISCTFDNMCGSTGMPYYKDLSEEFVADCCSILQEQYIDCMIKSEMKEIPADKYHKKSYNKYSITIDWTNSINSEEKTKDEVINDPMKTVLPQNEVISEIEILNTKVAKLEEEKVSDKLEIKNLQTKLSELENEISKLKSSNPIGTVTQVTTDLLDIFSGFGKIVELESRNDSK